jgi:hypothetical protein
VKEGDGQDMQQAWERLKNTYKILVGECEGKKPL